LGRIARLLAIDVVRYHTAMNKRPTDIATGASTGGDAQTKPLADRQERLSAALRANLARRKGQARARKDASQAAEGQGASAGYQDTGAASDEPQPTHDSAGFVADKPKS
jgi:hypothetical protein